MSGLEKFQANDAWRTHFKNLLLTERKIAPLPTEPVKQTQRFSLDIADDFIVILEEKKIPQPKPIIHTENKKQLHVKAMEGKNYKMFQSEDKENVSNIKQNRQAISAKKITMVDNIATTTNRYSTVSYCNETVLEDQELAQWEGISDESFETMEKMCDKTASDPNSTLFQYLHSDNKEKIVESAKKRSGTDIKAPVKGYDAEAIALQHLLDELRVEEQMQLENESPLKGVEVTQLEDIEAPSRLWENTFSGETMLQTSPVKMVGLLRPSTIMEDAEDSTSDVSSQSFQTVSAKAASEVSSACYETAHDTTATSCATTADAALQTLELSDDLCLSATSPITNKFFDKNGLSLLPEINISNVSEFIDIYSEEQPEVNAEIVDLEETIDLIDLEKTFGPLSNSPLTSKDILEKTKASNFTKKEDKLMMETSALNVEKESSESDDSIIEIISDEEDDDANEISILKSKAPIKYENISISTLSTSPKCSRSHLSDDIDDDKENSTRLNKSDDKSLHFNDTIEEVEYMMKKGMQYLAATNTEVKPSEPETSKTPTAAKSSPFKMKQNTFLLSPRSDDRYRSPSPMLHKQVPFSISSIMKAKNGNTTPKSREKPIAKPKPINPLSMKPFPKLDIFKKPTSNLHTSANMRHKDMAVKHFSHIVSPVRTYIKNSTNTPLMFTINDVNKNPDSLSSMKVLENEGRLYKPNFLGSYGGGGGGDTAILQSASEPRSLPKKAYVSSELKHIIDDRTKVTIPGGKQYQKHIETAILKAVFKHEGKAKLSDVLGDSDEASKQPKPLHSAHRTDSSLADLSVMSGDISVYTIKDAQRL